MNGFVVVDKPAGITSHDAVARCRRALKERRIGHAGTLDPAATGVLLIGVGRATRLLRFGEAHDKTYEATVLFGVTTTTQDAAGSTIEERDASGVTAAAIGSAIERFRGAIDQIPPMVSAIKVGGERLYAMARRGEEIARAPRPVTIHELTLLRFDPPEAGLRVRCSKGTYIRVLAADLGAALGCGAHLAALRRIAIGPHEIGEAVALEEVSAAALRPMADAVRGYPRRDVNAADALALMQGKRLAATGIDGPYAVWGPEGLVAMAEDRGEEARSLCVVSES